GVEQVASKIGGKYIGKAVEKYKQSHDDKLVDEIAGELDSPSVPDRKSLLDGKSPVDNHLKETPTSSTIRDSGSVSNSQVIKEPVSPGQAGTYGELKSQKKAF